MSLAEGPHNNERHTTNSTDNYGGDTNFNPLGMVGTPRLGMRTFRFWQPFRDFKHGNESQLKKLEAQFFQYLDKTKPRKHRTTDCTVPSEGAPSDGTVNPGIWGTDLGDGVSLII